MTKMSSRYALAAAISAALLSLPAHTQERNGIGAPRPALPPLEEIIVRSTRLETTLDEVPAAISVVSKDDIQIARQQLGLDESLSRVPGLFMQNRFNFAQDLRVSIRGFGARSNFGIRGVKILVDGIPETLPDGQGSVDGIDLGATEQIEVIRGPSSSLYGNASGGVISLTTEPPPSEPFAEVHASAGRYGYQRVQLKAGGSGERVGYLLNVSNTEYDGYREHSRFENRQLTGRFTVDLGEDRELLAVVNLTDQPVSDDPGGLTAAEVAQNPRASHPRAQEFRTGEALDQQRIGFVYTTPLGDGHSLSVRNYYVWRDFENALPIPGASGGIVHFERFYAGGGVSYTYDGVGRDRPNRLVVGIDYDDQDDDRRRFFNVGGERGDMVFDQNESFRSVGLFLQNELSINESLTLTMGLRLDEIEYEVTDRFLSNGDDSGRRRLDGTSPMVGLTYIVSPSLSAYATYSTAFETPSTTEFANPSGGGGFNPLLEPQEAENFEVGIRGLIGNRHRYDLALFSINVDDELIPFSLPGETGRVYYQNAGRSSRDGLELSFVTQPLDGFQATFAYTYSDFEFDRFADLGGAYDGNMIPGTPKHLVFGELSWWHPRGWFASLDALYVDDQFVNNANTVVNDAYTLSNLRLGYEHTTGSLIVMPYIGVNNLFDESYNANVRINDGNSRFFEPGPRRNVYAGVSVNWRY